MSSVAKGSIGSIKGVAVSDASRKMARPASGEVLTFAQEFDELNIKKKEIEAKLSGYSNLAFRKEQSKIRAAGGDTFGNWLKKSAQMDNERMALINQKVEVEKRMTFIAGRAKEERMALAQKENQERRGADSSKPIFQEILAELKAIRLLLERRECRNDVPKEIQAVQQLQEAKAAGRPVVS